MTPRSPASLCVPGWLEPLAQSLPEVGPAGWERLRRFERALSERWAHPSTTNAGGGGGPGSRARTLLGIRRHLAPHRINVAAPEERAEPEALVHTLVQFVCGFYDLDLRDTPGLGHGRMIAGHGSPTARRRWLPRLAAGELAGIAMTEPHGGSCLTGMATRLTPAVHAGRGGYVLTGRKCWVSRLDEAAVWVVFATGPAEGLSAVVVDARRAGISRHPTEPAGLTGWSWGELRFDAVTIAAMDILGAPGAGREVFTGHFTHYRALVTATALGAAARVHDTVCAHLAARRDHGQIGRVRDHALITIGRAFAQINAGLLACLHSQRLAAVNVDAAEMWGQTSKAHGVDLARCSVDELAVLMGAVGFGAAEPVQKARRDLEALRFADGMHDSLYRRAGRALLPSHHLSRTHPDTGTEAASPVRPASQPTARDTDQEGGGHAGHAG